MKKYINIYFDHEGKASIGRNLFDNQIAALKNAIKNRRLQHVRHIIREVEI